MAVSPRALFLQAEMVTMSCTLVVRRSRVQRLSAKFIPVIAACIFRTTEKKNARLTMKCWYTGNRGVSCYGDGFSVAEHLSWNVYAVLTKKKSLDSRLGADIKSQPTSTERCSWRPRLRRCTNLHRKGCTWRRHGNTRKLVLRTVRMTEFRLDSCEGNSKQAVLQHSAWWSGNWEAQLWCVGRKWCTVEEGEERQVPERCISRRPYCERRSFVHWQGWSQSKPDHWETSSLPRIHVHWLRRQGDCIQRLWSSHRKLKSFVSNSFFAPHGVQQIKLFCHTVNEVVDNKTQTDAGKWQPIFN